MVEPSVQLTVSEISICEGTPVVFTVQGTHLGDAPVYQWNVDGEVLAETGSTLTIDSLDDGQEVSVEVTSNANCVSTPVVSADPIAVAVFPSTTPSATMVVDANEICAGENARFTIPGYQPGNGPGL